MEKPSTTQEQSAEVKRQSAFLVENIESLRARQHQVLSSDLTDEEKKQKIDELTNEYVLHYGIEDDGHKSTLRQFSVDIVDEETWRYGEWNDENDHDKGLGPIGRDFVHEAQESFFGKRLDLQSNSSDDQNPDDQPDPDPDDDTEKLEAEKSERLEKLEELKKAKQEAYVAMINTGRYSPKRKKRMEAYEAAETAYAEALEEDIRLRLEEQLGDDLNEDQRAEIIKELADDQIHGDEEEQHTLLLER
ncbi:MAG: hypothetical protein EOM03_16040, partial [Clostridia bacterium]|nr:hypothetical protein [Clostridia bacterium]